MSRKASLLGQNLRALRNLRRGRVELGNLPTFLWVEPTNRCNLRCVMCPNGAGRMDFGKGDMPLDTYRGVLDQAAPHASTVVLALHGEPLLHKDLPEMVRYAALRGVKTNLNTNGTLMTREAAAALIAAGLSFVSFAFDGFDKAGYESVRRGARFESVLDNIRGFSAERARQGARSPYAILSILKIGLDRVEEPVKQAFLDGLRGVVDEVRMREVSSWGKTFTDSGDVPILRHEKLYPPCSRLWSSLCVAWNGDVLPCVYDANHDYVLGNIHQQSLAEIWNGEPMLALRRAMLDGTYLKVLPLCENCIVLGIPPLLGIPSGLRISLADAVVNYLGYGFERRALQAVNFLTRGVFAARTIS